MDKTPIVHRSDEIGRPEHYENAEVVRTYHERYEGGWAAWKHRRKLRLLAAWIGTPEPNRVLEVACGPGRFYEAYRQFPSVSVDRSQPMLNRSRLRYPDAPLVRSDAAALPFRSGSFDVVFSTRFLSHLRGEFRATVLRELVRVSARAVILDGRHPYNLRYASRWVRRRLRLSHADKLRHTFTQFREELGAAGLEVRGFRSIAWGLSGRFLVLAEKN